MFDWLKKKAAPAATKAPGFFSTDVRPHMARSEVITNSLAATFQHKTSDFAVEKDASGNLFAMDDNQGIQNVKAFSAFGQNLPDAQLLWYASQGFIGYQTCAMLMQNWLIDKAITMPARDAMRNGYDITVNDGTEVDPKILDYMVKMDRKFKAKKNCVEFVRFGRGFGIRIAMFMIDSKDPEYYRKPFNPDGITKGSYKGISQIDPYWITPMLDADAAANPASMDFYEPTWWRINGRMIHKSHLVIMRASEVPDILKPSYLYGGIPVTQKIFERVYAAERTANESPLLAMSKRLTSLKVDMSAALANQDAFEAKISFWTRLMNNFGVKILGEGEELNQFDTSLADLDAVIMTQYQIVAAASEVPATKLLGTAPKGFNSTGEYEEASYHEFLESIQEHDCAPLLERHHLCLIRSEIAHKFGIKPFNTEITWPPIDSLTAEEQAAVNKTKADTDTALVSTGGIDGYDVRARLIADKNSGYNGMAENPIVDIEGETDGDADDGDVGDSE